MTETIFIQEKTSIIVNSKNELLKEKNFQEVLKIYGTFPRAFNEVLLGESFYIDRNFWPTLSTRDCKELFEIIPEENFHAKKIVFRILINRGEITRLNVSNYLGQSNSDLIYQRLVQSFKEYATYMRIGDSL